MTVTIWRIATEAPAYTASDMSGAGAKLTGGRWNSKGVSLVYCSVNISLAALETLSYLNPGALPYNRFLVSVAIPDDVWSRRRLFDPLPGGWDAVPSGRTSQNAGDLWVAQAATALMVVPSVIIPDETNVLINPYHPDTARIVASTVKRWHYDPRFFPQSSYKTS